MNLGELRTAVRRKLAEGTVSGGVTGDAFDNDTIHQYINEAHRKYWVKMVEAGEGYDLTTADVNLVQGTRTYALANMGSTGAYKITRVWKVYSAGYKVELTYDERLGRTEYENTFVSSSASSYNPTYRLQGNNLYLEPPPDFNETGGLKCEIIPYPSDLSSDSHTPAIPLIFHDLIVVRSTLSCQQQQELTGGMSVEATDLRLELKEKEAEYEAALESRIKAQQIVIPYNLGDLDYI